MTIKELYRNFLVQLQKKYSLGEATTMSEWVFEKLLSLKRSHILRDPEKTISPANEKLVMQCLDQLILNKPVQYVLGEAWFYRLKFNINEHVLIPRPETEELVEQLIMDRKSKLTDPLILDIGTGSGCISIAIKKNLPASRVTAIEKSKEAIAVATHNAGLHHTHIQFIELDFLNESNWDQLPSFDIIISNPPYIPLQEKEKLAKNVVDFEPHLALFVPDNKPLVFYEKIAQFGKQHVLPGGRIYLETHEDYAQEAANLFRKNYQSVIIKKDMYGKERMLLITA